MIECYINLACILHYFLMHKPTTKPQTKTMVNFSFASMHCSFSFIFITFLFSFISWPRGVLGISRSFFATHSQKLHFLNLHIKNNFLRFSNVVDTKAHAFISQLHIRVASNFCRFFSLIIELALELLPEANF